MLFLPILLLIFLPAPDPRGSDTLAALPEKRATLWFQLDDEPSNNVLARSHGPEPGPDEFDNWSADDFVVADGESWQIDQVVIHGTYAFGGTASSFNIFIWEDNGGRPSVGPVVERLAIIGEHGPSTLITFDLVNPIQIGSGHYWLCVQANLGLFEDQFWWSSRGEQVGHGALTLSPPDIAGCNDWRPIQQCVLLPGGDLDLAFKIEGSINTAECEPISVPDEQFKSFLLARYDDDRNGELCSGEVRNVTALDISSLEIGSLTGIEAFSALQTLRADNNQLSFIPDLSGLTFLVEARFAANQITRLAPLPANLEILDCRENWLEDPPDVGSLSQLRALHIQGNRFTNTDCGVLREIENRQLDVFEFNPQFDDSNLICADDTTPPRIAILEPFDGDLFSVSGGVLFLGGTASDNIGLKSVLLSNNLVGSEFEAYSGNGEDRDIAWGVPGVMLRKGPNFITVLAEDTSGNLNTDTLVVTFVNNALNTPPLITDLIYPGAEVNVTLVARYAVSTFDDEQDDVCIFWDFGNGETRSGTEVLYGYPHSGEFDLTVTATDKRGASSTEIRRIKVVQPNLPPAIEGGLDFEPLNAMVGVPVRFTLDVSDPEGDELYFSWFFNDGQAQPSLGNEIFHSYNAPGLYFVQVKIHDGTNPAIVETAVVEIVETNGPAIGIFYNQLPTNIISTNVTESLAIPEIVFQIANTGLPGTRLRYEARIVDPTADWLQIKGGAAGESTGDAQDITLGFSQGLSRKTYQTDLEIVAVDGAANPNMVTIVLEVIPGNVRTKAAGSTSRNVTVEWEGARKLDAATTLVSVHRPGEDQPVLTKRTKSSEATLKGLNASQNYEIFLKTLDASDRVLDERQIRASTLAPETLPELIRLNHLAENEIWWTGTTMLNPNSKTADLLFEVLDGNGAVLETSSLRRLSPGQKEQGVLSQFFDRETLDKGSTLLIRSSLPLLCVQLFGRQDGSSMTGIPANDRASFTAHLLVGQSVETFSAFSLANPFSDRVVDIDAEAYNDVGQVAARSRVRLYPMEKRALLAHELLGPAWRIDDPNQTAGRETARWIKLSSDLPFTGFYLWGENGATVNGGGFAGRGALEMVLPLLEPSSRIYLANPEDVSNQVKVNFHLPSGVLFSSRTYDLLPKQRLILGFSERGSLHVSGRFPTLLGGDLTRVDGDRKKLGESIPGLSDFGRSLIAPHVASNDLFATELLLVNVNDPSTRVTIEAFDRNGTALGPPALRFLNGRAGLRETIRELFPGRETSAFAWLKIIGETDARLAGHVLFYSREGKGERMGGGVAEIVD